MAFANVLGFAPPTNAEQKVMNSVPDRVNSFFSKFLAMRERLRLKDPYSGLIHWIGAAFAVVGLIALLLEADGRPWHIWSFAIYGATLILLFTSSALYHSLRVSERLETALFGLDRAAIYLLIAGTYTPVCLLALRGGWGWSIFGVVWGCAVAGIVTDIVLRCKTPSWLQALFYLVTGWVVVVAIVPLMRALSPMALGWLAAGCVLYTVGAVVCFKHPKPLPGRFAAHDVWHVMVVAASACHWVMMFFWIARP